MNDQKKIIETAIRYRGSVINDVAWLEKLIDNFIIFHFTKEETKIIEMQLLLFGDNRLIFENKRQIFDYIAMKHHYDWYLGYETIREGLPKSKSIAMNKDLVWVIEERNKFTHLLLDSTEAGRNKVDTIGFLKFKNSPEVFEYKETQFKELMFVIYNLSNYIGKKIGM